MSAATRALCVLEYLAGASDPVSPRDLAAALDIPRSTLSDLMAELRSLGYVEQVGGRYAPGVALALLGHRLSYRPGSSESLRAALERLVELTGETAIYSVGIGRQSDGPRRVLIIDQVASRDPIRYVAPSAPLRLMSETASGRVLLAFSERREEEDEALARELEQARRDGYYVNEAASGATSIAAPVFDVAGQVSGALAVTGPSFRMADAATRIWPTLRDAVASLGP
jgi:DNA-binding IclR family transcriptional regulator